MTHRRKQSSQQPEIDDDTNNVLDDEEVRRFHALVEEVNDLAAKLGVVGPSNVVRSDPAGTITPPFPPEPELCPLSAAEAVSRVVSEFLPGEVVLVGRKQKGAKETKPYTALLVAEDRSETVQRLLLIFEAIIETGDIAYWKLNPYQRDPVEAHAGVKLSEKWNGKKLFTKKETWVDDHIARIAFFSGDHDIGRTEEDAKTWENAIPFEDAVPQYWYKIQMLGAGPMLTLFQDSGRGFSPIWQIDPPIVYTDEVKQEVKGVLAELLSRARGLAVDVGIYNSVNPFIRAPGTVHAATGRASTYFVVGDSELYNVDNFHDYFEQVDRWWRDRPSVSIYPDDPVPRKKRKVSEGSRAAYTQRLGPSYAVIRDLLLLLDHWNNDLTKRSNAFFRCYAWHRRNILWTEVGVEAGANHENLTETEYVKRVYDRLHDDMQELNERTGRRIDEAKMNGYLNANFPKKPMSTSKWAGELGVDAALARQLDLQTIIPADERQRRDEVDDSKRAARNRLRDSKNKALDEMILSPGQYDYSRFTKEQVRYRRKKLIEAGRPVPDRRAGRRKKK